jgi:LPS-assembly lipoprotein
MSSLEKTLCDKLCRAAVVALVAAMPVLGACTVQPLYYNPSSGGVPTGVTAELSSIAIKPVETRYAQEVRNHLIFLLNGGSGQPAVARYTLALNVTAVNQSAAVVQRAKENEPTAGTVTLTAHYILTETETGKIVSDGRRQIASSYDKPRQEYAALRAERDAQNRAARELADLLKLVLAQDLTHATQ